MPASKGPVYLMALTSYESWDIRPLTIPARTRLVSLKPIGVGTAYVESLTSYTCRLAHAHSVRVGKLFSHEIVPTINKLYPLDDEKRTKGKIRTNYPANRGHMLHGVGKCADDLVRALEALTLRRDLRLLTYLPWKEVLSEIGLLRRTRAWCPHCFGEWLCEGREIYEPLLWRLNAVTVCPAHQSELATMCSNCGRRQRLIESNSRLGFCQECGTWIGKLEAEITKEDHQTEDFDFRLWATFEIGRLLAAGPRLTTEPGRDQVARAIRVCAQSLAAGNGHAFSRISHLPRDRMHFWMQGKVVPVLHSILKICHKMCIPLVDFLTLEDPLAGGIRKRAAIILEAKKVITHRRKTAREVMRQTLSENPAPSVEEIARRLGYKSIGSLRKVSAELYLKIVERRRAIVARKSAREKRRSVPPHNKDEVRNALKVALSREPALTLHDVANELGYSSYDGGLSKTFPRLCKSLVRRRMEYLAKRDEDQKRELRKVLRENPSPPLREVERRLGYKNGSSLRKRFPQLSAAILANHKAHRQRQATELLHRLRSVLREDEPPSLASVARRLNQERNLMRKHFPDLCREISERHAEFRRSQVVKTRAACEEEIRRFTARLQAEGKYPTMKLVKSRMTRPEYFDYVTFWTILCDEKRRLAID